ncbi:hypothetical protein L1887_18092 [Cichorium endivia]|nr:hypothetical protein L1887_18092 [Cichorium endivia]
MSILVPYRFLECTYRVENGVLIDALFDTDDWSFDSRSFFWELRLSSSSLMPREEAFLVIVSIDKEISLTPLSTDASAVVFGLKSSEKLRLSSESVVAGKRCYWARCSVRIRRAPLSAAKAAD